MKRLAFDPLAFKNTLPRGQVSCEVPASAVQFWDKHVKAAAETDDDATISILDFIGSDFFGEGVTAKRVAAALRNIGEKPVTVLLNSPGGDMFEGMAIYNLLEQHRQKVTVKVLSLAASAASTIAMAGDEIQIAKGGFFMIHNAWLVAMGNRHDLRAVADWLEPFDRSIRDTYADRTGVSEDKLEAMLDDETWLGSNDAIKLGFADGTLSKDEVTDDGEEPDDPKTALKKLTAALSQAGLTRSQSKSLIKSCKFDTPGAVDNEEDTDPLEGDNMLSAVDPARLIKLAERLNGELRK